MAIQKEAEMTCVNHNWTALVHIFALVNVINQKIFSVYPNVNEALRPLFHGEVTVVPYGEENSKTTIMILWSRDRNLDNRNGAVYDPNHFVPIHFIDFFDD